MRPVPQRASQAADPACGLTRQKDSEAPEDCAAAQEVLQPILAQIREEREDHMVPP